MLRLDYQKCYSANDPESNGPIRVLGIKKAPVCSVTGARFEESVLVAALFPPRTIPHGSGRVNGRRAARLKLARNKMQF